MLLGTRRPNYVTLWRAGSANSTCPCTIALCQVGSLPRKPRDYQHLCLVDSANPPVYSCLRRGRPYNCCPNRPFDSCTLSIGRQSVRIRQERVLDRLHPFHELAVELVVDLAIFLARFALAEAVTFFVGVGFEVVQLVERW